MRKIFRLLVFLLPVSVMIISCYPEYDATVEELDLAITKYDKEQNFEELSTFFLYDTIVYITDDESILQVNVDHTQENHILSGVRQNLIDKGWTEVTDPSNGETNADVSIMISVLESDVTFYYYYWWDYWYWYPWDWWYPWYPSYPWYPGYPAFPGYPTYPSSGYTVGTVFIDMVNMNDVEIPESEDASFKLPIVWTGTVNGILAGSDASIGDRLTKQIGQVFEQSTYLHK
ncbi:MAG: DUF4136 domain-containing protein [Bacteroidota bacterium]